MTDNLEITYRPYSHSFSHGYGSRILMCNPACQPHINFTSAAAIARIYGPEGLRPACPANGGATAFSTWYQHSTAKIAIARAVINTTTWQGPTLSRQKRLLPEFASWILQSLWRQFLRSAGTTGRLVPGTRSPLSRIPPGGTTPPIPLRRSQFRALWVTAASMAGGVYFEKAADRFAAWLVLPLPELTDSKVWLHASVGDRSINDSARKITLGTRGVRACHL